MRGLCNKCAINCNIEVYKERLNNIIIRKNFNLLDDEVIEMSQFIDELIYNCAFCNVDNIYNLKKKSSTKSYENLYYYGKQHLFLNLYYYISEGIKNNEAIYISVKEGFYNQLIEELKINRIPVNDIKLINLELKDTRKKCCSLDKIEENLNEIFLYDENKYTGIRWIIKPLDNIDINFKKYSIDLKFLKDKYKENSETIMLLIYDVYEYMNKHKNYDNEFINGMDTSYYQYSGI